MKNSIIIDSRIHKRNEKNLTVKFTLEEEELNFLMKLYQAYKRDNLTSSLSIETFIKSLIVENIEYYKQLCNYNELYKEEK